MDNREIIRYFESFLDSVNSIENLNVLSAILSEKLKEYARDHDEGFEKSKGDFFRTYKAREDWLNHAIFLSKKRYRETQNPIFSEIVCWCEYWKGEWLATFYPYSPAEIEERNKDLKKPLWQVLEDKAPTQSPISMPSAFEDLFKDSKLAQSCIDILKEVDPPILNNSGGFIGKTKGAICVWVDELERHSFLHHVQDKHAVYATLIPKVINGFSIDKSMFGKYHKRSEKYRIDFKTLLSQLSQKGK